MAQLALTMEVALHVVSIMLYPDPFFAFHFGHLGATLVVIRGRWNEAEPLRMRRAHAKQWADAVLDP